MKHTNILLGSITMLLILVLLLGLKVPTFAIGANDDEGLVAFWDFENISGTTLEDVTGNIVDGTIKGGAGTVDVTGGKALYLDGTDDCAYIPYDAKLAFKKTDSFTFSLWFNIDESITSRWHMIAGMGRASTDYYSFYLDNQNNKIQYLSYDGSNKEARNFVNSTKGTWHCVTVVHDGASGKFNLYSNGESIVTYDVKVDWDIAQGGFSIGATPSNIDGTAFKEYFKGQIDNIRIYNRTLTATEIGNLYDVEKKQYEKPKDYVQWSEEWPELGADSSTPVNIILDTDAAPDCDDAGALSMLHHYANEGQANLLAMVCSTSCQYGAPWLDAINTYYGRPNIPVGTMKSNADIMPHRTDFNLYIAQHWENDIYNGVLAPDAVKVYRKALAAAEDNSVVIVNVGMLTNLADLLKSEADEYSDLSGYELVKQKVKLVSAMGGSTEEPEYAEFNILHDITSAQYVTDNWPTPMMFSSVEIGEHVMTGGTRYDDMEADNPVMKSYDLKCGVGKTRPSWDLTSVLYAMEGLNDYWTMTRGDLSFTDEGYTVFKENATGARAFLVKKMQDVDVASRLNYLMTAAKKNNPDERKFELFDFEQTAEDIAVNNSMNKDTKNAKYYYDGHAYYSNNQELVIAFDFYGDGIEVYAGMNKDNCIVDIYLDGEKVDTVDLYSADKVYATAIYTNFELEIGEHTIAMVNSGEKNSLSSNTHMCYDYFKVYTEKSEN